MATDGPGGPVRPNNLSYYRMANVETRTHTKTKTILLVDDDPDYLMPIETQLRNAGFSVSTAESMKDALARIEHSMPDMAIVDLMMEHDDSGFVLCHHLKRRNPSIPVILVTALTRETGLEFDADTDEERSWIKADVMLDKPVRFEQLLREIDRLLKD